MEEREEELRRVMDEAMGEVLLLRRCLEPMLGRGGLELETVWGLTDYLDQHLRDIRLLAR